MRHFTLEYWLNEGWYVGRLKEVPGVFSHGETLDELEKNIQEAYKLMMEEEAPVWFDVQEKEINVEVRKGMSLLGNWLTQDVISRGMVQTMTYM